MKLVRVSIHGFKSFADKITLDIKDGITGIVGPNGSGKSNIVDAVSSGIDVVTGDGGIGGIADWAKQRFK